jgi:hypothetical protein
MSVSEGCQFKKPHLCEKLHNGAFLADELATREHAITVQ